MSKDLDFSPTDIDNVAKSLGVGVDEITNEQFLGKDNVPEPQQAEEPQQWVHEPTGKTFDSEQALLKYESGWKDSRYGEEIAKLREKLESLETTRHEQPQQPQVASDVDIMKRIWEGMDEEVLQQEYAKFVFKGLKALDAGVTGQMQKVMQEIAGLKQQMEENVARNSAGVDVKLEQEILGKHPGLKALPFAERMAVIKEMAASKKPGESPQPKPRATPKPNAADHVEGSVQSTPMTEDDQFDTFFGKYAKMDVDEQLSAFTKIAQGVARSGMQFGDD